MTYTETVRQYITQKFLDSKEKDQESIELHASIIHKELGFNKKYPIVCNAMQQMMTDKDTYLKTTESGQSSTIIIKYYLKNK